MHIDPGQFFDAAAVATPNGATGPSFDYTTAYGHRVEFWRPLGPLEWHPRSKTEPAMDLELLKRFFHDRRGRTAPTKQRSWVRPTNLPEPFHHAADISSLHEILAHLASAQQAPSGAPETLRGDCYVCRQRVDFQVSPPGADGTVNWRETLSCPTCGLINRWRSSIHLFEAVCEPNARDRIYLTETLSPVYRTLATRYPELVGSEYLPQLKPGVTVRWHGRQVRNEDVTRLSFDDECLEAVLCFDVLEHVPDYRQALREFFRVLTRGGQLVVSVPFSFQQETVVRAVIDGMGNIEHLLPPCYHGDPLAADGVLSYYDFGMDLLADMQRAGFSETFLVCYRSTRWGYPNENVAYVARKLAG